MSAIQKLDVDIDKCIGCQACTHVCPQKCISFGDNATDRTLQFAQTCAQDCTKCADACSENAITLLPMDQTIEGTFSAKFPLWRCTGCKMGFTTEKMVQKLQTSIPALLVPDDRDWLNTCPLCRRTTEAKQVAGRRLMSRWGSPGDRPARPSYS